MENSLITQLFTSFEEIKHISEDDSEYWSARDLQVLLAYKDWRNFEIVIEKAMTACREAGNSKFDHFVGVNKMVSLGSDAEREIFDIHLTRYAAYLIAQNGDSRKQEIAFAQAYFAVQTRKQELVEKKLLDYERIHVREKLTQTEKQLTGLAFERWVDGMGMARIRSKGDTILFGWNNTKAMKEKLGVHEDRSLADFLPTVLLKAKDLAAEVTNHNIRENKNMKGENAIISEHSKNNQWVREFLIKSGITPENLPPATDIQKLKRQQETEVKKLGDVCIVGVPMHWSRYFIRGFNHIDLLVSRSSKKIGIPYKKPLQAFFTRRQSKLSKSKRIKNRDYAFWITKDAVLPRTVILIDDIISTGSTADACAKILKSRGVEKVYGIFIASNQ